jgi:hypothetical protein
MEAELDLAGVLPEILDAEPVGQTADEGIELESSFAASNDAENTVSDADSETEEEEDEDEVQEEAQADSRGRARRAADEPASFLGMYFRDMAELDVLRPEQEFETARNIEQMEIDLWRTILGFAPGASWISETVDKAAEQPLAEMKMFNLLAERSRKKSSRQPLPRSLKPQPNQPRRSTNPSTPLKKSKSRHVTLKPWKKSTSLNLTPDSIAQ